MCEGTDLSEVLSLGELFPAGRFLEETSHKKRDRHRMALLECNRCGLVQLDETGLSLNEQYGRDYGYRSGLNGAMVAHLKALAATEKMFLMELGNGPKMIVEIGANDGTHLREFVEEGNKLVAIDPTLATLQTYYNFECECVADFFPTKRVKIEDASIDMVVSHACTYDVPDLSDFVREIARILRPGGFWSSEQSHLWGMIDNNAFDSVCDEHISYFEIQSFERVARQFGLYVEYLSLSNMNGASFHIIARKRSELCVSWKPMATRISESSRVKAESLQDMLVNIEVIKCELHAILSRAKERSEIYIIGASTKGSIITQVLGVGGYIDAILEVNDDKIGKYMAGCDAPIIREDGVDLYGKYVLIMIWHYGESMIRKYLEKGANVIMPLPTPKLWTQSGTEK